ncbi:hypothetical protein JYU34_004243 [Plutella xylostella]|uniref:Uncharacterized protein n=1 Tax=Plutella xylostella TaxID=51655 RepID=A0ABQ7QXI4_PLUXY|nr:hypothetical protein JYU34_004243 [Plutella xylostella]
MYSIRSVRVRQLAKWKEYHSGLGVFGHRPQTTVDSDAPKEVLSLRNEHSRAQRLVEAYRTHGHKRATIDNVDYRQGSREVKELETSRYGLSPQDEVDLGLLYGRSGKEPVQNLVQELEDIYCGPISYEYSYLETEAEREWFARRVETTSESDKLDKDRKIQIAKELLHSQTWDKFLATKFPTVKRYCGEGAESLLTFFSSLFRLSTEDSVEHLVVGMAHRGKLNALTGVLQCRPARIFHKFSGNPEFPEEANSTCDISTHFSVSEDIKVNNKTVRVSLLNNPSHLEVSSPVSMGKTRAKQLQIKEGDYSPDGSSRMGDKIVNVQIHGDAAFTGQGVNQETLMLTQAPHFHVGGSLHVVVNNQVGFTLPGHRGRSSRYVTDLAKVIAAPVIHVNGDHPELVAKATSIAFEYQRLFRKDVFIDYNCFRRWGHNELDDPTFTNPLLYRMIHARPSIPDLYAEKLKAENVLSEDDVSNICKEYSQYLQSEFDAVKSYQPEASYYHEQWSKMGPAPHAVETWDTGVDTGLLKMVGLKSVTVPDDFNIHPHLAKTHVKNRLTKISEEKDLDWATAEALAFAKWVRSNGLVLLLPHGYDGAGPEHSSCRLERFLQLSDSREAAPDCERVCLHVVHPTTPAQYFHVLRRQMARNYRKPLVVVAPKVLLRLADAVSPLSDFAPGTYFKTVIGDTTADPIKVKRVILVSGKHYYELHKERVKGKVEDVAIIRVESLAPFPLSALQAELDKYTNARKFIWSQEEHRNMGAWSFVKTRFENLLGRRIIYSGRAESAAPAVGTGFLHRKEVEHIVKDPLYNLK